MLRNRNRYIFCWGEKNWWMCCRYGVEIWGLHAIRQSGLLFQSRTLVLVLIILLNYNYCILYWFVSVYYIYLSNYSFGLVIRNSPWKCYIPGGNNSDCFAQDVAVNFVAHTTFSNIMLPCCQCDTTTIKCYYF